MTFSKICVIISYEPPIIYISDHSIHKIKVGDKVDGTNNQYRAYGTSRYAFWKLR